MTTLEFRRAIPADLETINYVIESAVMNWPMATRVKRLSLAALKYDATDLEHLDVHVCVRREEVIGVAALDHDFDTDESRQGLLHGLYVLPIVHGQGIGRRLMNEVFTAARAYGLETVIVRAESVSAGYFVHQNLDSLQPEDDSVYPYRFSKSLESAA